ncbi:MAG: hypothetical protein AAF317_11000 [Pseudomonadota bacterium]
MAGRIAVLTRFWITDALRLRLLAQVLRLHQIRNTGLAAPSHAIGPGIIPAQLRSW